MSEAHHLACPAQEFRRGGRAGRLFLAVWVGLTWLLLRPML
jgi:hypothetical protein